MIYVFIVLDVMYGVNDVCGVVGVDLCCFFELSFRRFELNEMELLWFVSVIGCMVCLFGNFVGFECGFVGMYIGVGYC